MKEPTIQPPEEPAKEVDAEPPGTVPELLPGETLRQRIKDKDWNDWKWQLRNRIVDVPDELRNGFPVSITPYYYMLTKYPEIAKCVLPSMEELKESTLDEEDPLCEEHDSPCKGIVHRYPDRVLFLVSNFCSTYCRYCTRSRLVGRKDELGEEDLERAYVYIESHKEIRDVLISGGDPLTMTTEKLERIIRRIRFNSHVEIIRIGTKVPVVLPMRITKELVTMLKKYHPIYINIHFTHPREVTHEVKEACTMLADAGIPLGSQTVLLKGVNDNAEVMKNLMRKLVAIRVIPRYIYQCDHVKGSSHFYTKVQDGINIMKKLQGYTTGFAVPKFVIDSSIGKIPVGPEYFKKVRKGKYILSNYKDENIEYYDTYEK